VSLPVRPSRASRVWGSSARAKPCVFSARPPFARYLVTGLSWTFGGAANAFIYAIFPISEGKCTDLIDTYNYLNLGLFSLYLVGVLVAVMLVTYLASRLCLSCGTRPARRPPQEAGVFSAAESLRGSAHEGAWLLTRAPAAQLHKYLQKLATVKRRREARESGASESKAAEAGGLSVCRSLPPAHARDRRRRDAALHGIPCPRRTAARWERAAAAVTPRALPCPVPEHRVPASASR
jgi:hypothetical protein